MTRSTPRRLALTALLVVSILGAPAIAASSHSTLAVEDGQIAAGETTTVAVTLSSIPDGLSGFNVTVELRDPEAATITDAALNQTFGIRDATIRGDGTAVRLKAVDMDQTLQPGDGPVRLGNVTVSADSDAGTALALRIDQVDDDDGERVEPATSPGQIGADVETPAQESGGGASGPGDPTAWTLPLLGAAVFGALVFVVGTVGLLSYRG